MTPEIESAFAHLLEPPMNNLESRMSGRVGFRRYIVCIADDDLWLVGPFESEKALVHYGHAWQERNGDDPRWQEVFLADIKALSCLRIEAP